MNQMLIGGIVITSTLAGLFFLRFWKRTGDRFFFFLATSFWVEAVNRLVLGLVTDQNEDRPLFYFIRFLSFLVILIAIVDKNWRGKRVL